MAVSYRPRRSVGPVSEPAAVFSGVGATDPQMWDAREVATAESDDQQVSYDERLRVPLLWWIVPALFVATLWLAYVVAAGPAWAALVAVTSGAIVAACLLSYGNARVRVWDGELVAGRARIPVTAIGAVRRLDRNAARRLRGAGGDPRAYLLIRPYLPEAVRVDIADPADPTPYWYVATRRPEELARALTAARAAIGHI